MAAPHSPNIASFLILLALTLLAPTNAGAKRLLRPSFKQPPLSFDPFPMEPFPFPPLGPAFSPSKYAFIPSAPASHQPPLDFPPPSMALSQNNPSPLRPKYPSILPPSTHIPLPFYPSPISPSTPTFDQPPPCSAFPPGSVYWPQSPLSHGRSSLSNHSSPSHSLAHRFAPNPLGPE
uniref:Uncharacterized protein n=1 Tax=Opuntia streptacantha TaxID=393608 RepID=A0A7C9AXY6_OPUST